MSLQEYRRKRRFDDTPEPAGRVQQTGQQRFVVQEHHASQLHFDFRLEMGGILKSWAIPKGPSLDPADRRLAVAVEDHPISYLDFAGHIAEGNYGAGEVVIWDSGGYELVDQDDPLQALRAGKLPLRLYGEVLRGEFNLFRLSGREDQWLLVKRKDQHARPGWQLSTRLDSAGRDNGGGQASPRRRRSPAAKKRGQRASTSRPAAPSRPARKRAGRAGPLPGAVAAPMPDRLEPMLATLVDRPFADPDWVFETKWDGVRALAFVEAGRLRLVTRSQHEVAFRYPELVGLPRHIRARQAILDGEIVALDAAGRSSFQRLQARVGLQTPGEIKRLARVQPVLFQAFDLLYHDGYDLRASTLEARKALLRDILKEGALVRYSAHVAEAGPQAFRQAQAEGLEGLIAKRRDSPYAAGRSGDWLKIKTVLRQEVVVGGYTAPRGSRPLFGALVTGYYRDGQLVYAGHVGGGFSHADLERLHERLAPLETRRSPFADPPSTNEAVTWVRPRLVVEVKFAEWTTDGCLRQPIFLGVRDDKAPRQVRREVAQPASAEVERAEARTGATRSRKPAGSDTAADENGKTLPAGKAFARRPSLAGSVRLRANGHLVTLTHADKRYWPDDGYTKADLARYYWQVADTLLPYLRHRPLILKRYPNGIGGASFFQHDVDDVPAFVHTIAAEAGDGRMIDYVLADNRATLLYLANQGNIALNPWHSRVKNLDSPDWVVFDLDPGEVEFETVCAVALAVRDVLDRLGLDACAKTSGSRGLHIYVPLRAGYAYDLAADLARRVAELVAAENPAAATVVRSIKQRPAGTVYVDHLQNARGKSVVAPYSVRARPGATVSTPLTWPEVKRCVDPGDFTVESVPRRLSRRGDLFAPVLRQKQSLAAALKRLERLRAAGPGRTGPSRRPDDH